MLLKLNKQLLIEIFIKVLVNENNNVSHFFILNVFKFNSNIWKLENDGKTLQTDMHIQHFDLIRFTKLLMKKFTLRLSYWRFLMDIMR